MLPASVARELLDRLLAGEGRTKAALQKLKQDAARRHKLRRMPSDPDLLAHARPEERALLEPWLRIKATRSISGVAILTVQSPPEACPHGTCTFCPGGPRFGTAQSYTGREPAALRAAQAGFDPYVQAAGRLAALHGTGHHVDKVDVIMQGGTFPARDAEAQREFVAGVLEAMNDYDAGAKREAREASGISSSRSSSHPSALARLLDAQLANESAASRMIGLTVETKPDWGLEPHADVMLDLGVTRVEVGVQTLDDGVLAAVNRGHTVADTIRSFRALKDAGFKLCAHVMPGLPGADDAKDLATFERLFADPDFRPDMLKIYPTLVVPGTPLHRQWERGDYVPLSDEKAAALVARAKTLVPPWCRIQRVDRDIPTPMIAAGVMKLNLRELAWAEMRANGWRCRCLRCREAGHAARRGGFAASDLDLALTTTRYASSGGEEVFLAFEEAERDAVAGYARIRAPSPHAWRGEAAGAWILRELKVVGLEVPLGERREGGLQHGGLGRRLLAEAERLAAEAGARKMLVTAGVGVRAYYAKHGYVRDGPYMGKSLA